MGIIYVEVILGYNLGSQNTFSTGIASSLTPQFIPKTNTTMGKEFSVTSEQQGDKGDGNCWRYSQHH